MANPASYAPHCVTRSNVDLWIFDHVQSFADCREDRNLDAANYGRISDSGNSVMFEPQRRDDRKEASDSRTRLELPTGRLQVSGSGRRRGITAAASAVALRVNGVFFD